MDVTDSGDADWFKEGRERTEADSREAVEDLDLSEEGGE